jgi:hypothetical protein
VLLRRTGFDPRHGLCDTCAGGSIVGVGLSPRTYVFPCRYHPIILHAHLYKAAFSKKNALFTSKLDLNFKEETSKVLHLEHSFVWCWNWTLWKVYQKYLESFEILCWRRMEKISWIDGARNERRGKLERNVLQTVERRKANWIGHVLRMNCLLEYIIEGKVERRAAVTGRLKGRRKQLLDDLRETRR